jgi:hypothetical protein
MPNYYYFLLLLLLSVCPCPFSSILDRFSVSETESLSVLANAKMGRKEK